MSLLSKLFKSEDEKLIKKLAPIVEEVFALEDGLKNISDAELKDKSIVVDKPVDKPTDKSPDKSKGPSEKDAVKKLIISTLKLWEE